MRNLVANFYSQTIQEVLADFAFQEDYPFCPDFLELAEAHNIRSLGEIIYGVYVLRSKLDRLNPYDKRQWADFMVTNSALKDHMFMAKQVHKLAQEHNMPRLVV